MIYYTQLVFIKKGHEEMFHSFEEKVLPFLKKYNGELVYRVRPDQNSVIEINNELPYEIHIITFERKADFENYKNDAERLKYIQLKNDSVKNIILIEGEAI